MPFSNFIKTALCITPPQVEGDDYMQCPSGSGATSASDSLPASRGGLCAGLFAGLSSRGTRPAPTGADGSIAPRQTLPRRASEAAPSQQAPTLAPAGAQAQKEKKNLTRKVKNLLGIGHRSKSEASTLPVPTSAGVRMASGYAGASASRASCVVTGTAESTAESIAPRQTLHRRASETAASQQASTSATTDGQAQKQKKPFMRKAKSLLGMGHGSKSEASKSRRPTLQELLDITAEEVASERRDAEAERKKNEESERRLERMRAQLFAQVDRPDRRFAGSGGAQAGTSGDAPQVTSEQPRTEQTSEMMNGTAAQQHPDALGIVPEYSQPTAPRPTVASNDTRAIVPVGWTYPDERAGGTAADAPERAPAAVPSHHDPLSSRDTFAIAPFADSQSEARGSVSPPRHGLRGPSPDNLPAPPTRWLGTESEQLNRARASTSAPSVTRDHPNTPLIVTSSNPFGLPNGSHVIDIPDEEIEIVTPGAAALMAAGLTAALHAVDERVKNVATTLEQCLAHCMPGPLAPDVRARLKENAATLVQAGIDSPELLHAWAQSCQGHDRKLAMIGLGFAKNVGYFVGMTAANEWVIPQLPARFLTNPSALGSLVGLGVAGIDVFLNELGAGALAPFFYRGSAASLPPSIVANTNPFKTIIQDVGWAAGLNVLKNSLRIPAPWVQSAIEGHPDHRINRTWAERIDISLLDGGLGFISAGANEYRKVRSHGGIDYAQRLLLQDPQDLQRAIERSQGRRSNGILEIAKSAAKPFSSPAVPLAAVTSVALFLSILLARNSSLDATGHAGSSLPPNMADPNVFTEKRVSSLELMGLMSGFIEFAAPAAAVAGDWAWKSLKDAAGGLPNIGEWMARMTDGNEPILPRVWRSTGGVSRN